MWLYSVSHCGLICISLMNNNFEELCMCYWLFGCFLSWSAYLSLAPCSLLLFFSPVLEISLYILDMSFICLLTYLSIYHLSIYLSIYHLSISLSISLVYLSYFLPIYSLSFYFHNGHFFFLQIFKAALFIITKNRKQHRCPSMGK